MAKCEGISQNCEGVCPHASYRKCEGAAYGGGSGSSGGSGMTA